MNNIQRAKEILGSMVESNQRKGASFVPSLSGSDAVVFSKVRKAYQLLCEETHQGQWRAVADGWLPQKRNELSCISVNVACWDGETVIYNCSYEFDENEFCDYEGYPLVDLGINVTHFIEMEVSPPGQVRI